jgi:hypothetical protein
MTGILLLAFLPAALVVAEKVTSSPQGRVDLIVIDVLSTHGPLERPPVGFYHDKHTEALAKQNKDCLTCHELVKDRLQPAFGRTAEMPRETVMETFHDRCIGCHKESGTTAGETRGPITCGACHVKEDVPQIDDTNWSPIDLDKSLHYRHVMAAEKKCELCHHQYNEQTKKLVYEKGREGACLYCHKEQDEDNRISNRSASHLACVGCHRQKAAAELKAGPVQCAGCHDPQKQASIEKLKDIPRPDRNQPDMVLVKAVASVNQGNPVAGEDPAGRVAVMGAVAFDHKAHEGYNATCKGCHHAELKPCAQCHTLQGDKDGGQVKLAQAMHQQDAGMSCIGCHNSQKEQAQCIGCHHSIPQARTLTSPEACQTCHSGPSLDITGTMAPDQSAAMAAELLAARQPVRDTVAPADIDQIPETVTIGYLVDTYEAVKLPHRRMVLALAQVNQDSDLAAHFHRDPLTLCQGCHHNSPASLKPPQCGSCHGRTSEALNLTRPGLLAAYHQQCLECHNKMGIEKPASRECTACHAKRQQTAKQD